MVLSLVGFLKAGLQVLFCTGCLCRNVFQGLCYFTPQITQIAKFLNYHNKLGVDSLRRKTEHTHRGYQELAVDKEPC